MASVVNYPHIEKGEATPARLSRLPRIRVAQIAIDYRMGRWSPEEIALRYPHLKLPEIYSAITYYLDHQAEIDAEIEADEEFVSKTQQELAEDPVAVVERLRALKKGQ